MSDPPKLAVIDITIDLLVDFNTEDDTGLSWTYRDRATDPSKIVPGRCVVAGMTGSEAVVRIVDVDDDGLVHVLPIPGTVEANQDLLDAEQAAS